MLFVVFIGPGVLYPFSKSEITGFTRLLVKITRLHGKITRLASKITIEVTFSTYYQQ